MTGNAFFDGILIFLIVYAILNILYEFTDAFADRFSRYHPKDYLILPLVHGTESLEWDIRTASKRSCNLNCVLIIVCDGLDKDEEMILWRLTDQCDNVLLSSPEELTEKIEAATALNSAL